MKSFFQILASLSARHMRFIEQPPVDLSVPTALNEAMSNLREIMSIYNDSSPEEDDANSFDRVLELTIGPALELITKMAALRVSDWDQSIFWINCLEFMIATLAPFTFTHEKKQELEEQLKKHLALLTQEHFDQLLKSSGLQPIIQALDTKEDIPLSRMESASSKQITASVRQFDEFLTELDTLVSTRLTLLSSTKHSSKVHHDSLGLITSAYSRVWDAVMDPLNRYEFGSTLLVRSKEEVKTLTG